MSHFKINFSNKANKDIDRISKHLEEYGINASKVIKRIYENVENLKFMPRIHKTLYYFKDKNNEYRRIVSGKYIIIYKIEKEQITILRIFHHKENYLNSKKFILKEKSIKYVVN